MNDTTQFNIRLSKALIYDMEFIAENLKISRNDWLKFRLAELIREEKVKIMENIENKFISGLITEEQFKQKAGFKPTPEIKKIKQGASKSSKEYLQDVLKKIEAKEK